MVAEIEARSGELSGQPADTIFFGGGTPSLWAPDRVGQVIAAARGHLGLNPDAEISLEANPGTVDRERLAAYQDAGVNRLSLGVQSLHDETLAALDRIHDRTDVIAAVEDARRAGFDNLSLDLIFGLPEQTIEAWLADVRAAIDLAPEHLSLYSLTISEDTPLGQAVHNGSVTLPAEDTVAAMLEQGLTLATAAGFAQYEVSNLARPGKPCRHNLGYWTGGDYLGVGAAAASFRHTGTGVGERVVNARDPDDYLRDREGTAERESLAPDDLVRERLLTGLRLVEGIDLDALAAEIGAAPFANREDELERLIEEGLLVLDGNWLCPTGRGLMFADALAVRLAP